MSNPKVTTYKQAISKIRDSKNQGLKTVLAIGGFDIVHIGHIEYLRSAKSKGDLLFVGLENDETLKLNKSEKRPFNKLSDRLDLLAELESVDFVFGFEGIPVYNRGNIFLDRFKELNPDLLVSSSWDPTIEVKKRVAKKAGIKLVAIPAPKINSSTNLLQLIGYE